MPRRQKPKFSSIMQRYVRVKRAYPEIRAYILRLFRTPKLSPSYPDNHRRASTLYVILATGCRPGSNRNLTQGIRTYGLTTLNASHVKVSDSLCAKFEYAGKRNMPQNHKVCNSKVRAWVQYALAHRLRLFLTDAQLRHDPILTSLGIQPKDVRTWKANQIAEQSTRLSKKEILAKVAKVLGNTASVCGKYYVAPEILSKAKGSHYPKPKR